MSCELFVGNLNPEVRMRDLENVYGRYGRIVRCDLKKNFGFIQFEDRRDAEEAILKENNRKLLGSVMTVEWAKGSVGDKPRGFRRPRSPDRGPRGRGRDRSPYGGGRARSPIGRGNFSGPPRSSFSPREDRFGGGGRRPMGQRDFDGPRFDRGAPPRDRAPRDRYGGGDRFQNDRGSRRPPMRENGFNDRPPRGDRFGDRRESFGERRSSFGGGPRRF